MKDGIINTLLIALILASCVTAALAEPDDSFTKDLLHMNGAANSTTFTDEIGKTWVAHGNAQIWTSPAHFSQVGAFLADGTDYISTGDSVDFDLANGSWTFDWWGHENMNGAAGSDQPWVLYQDASNYYVVWIYYSYIDFIGHEGGDLTVEQSATGISVPTNQWNHYEINRDPANNTYHIFLNGVKKTLTTAAGTDRAIPDLTWNLNIGRGYIGTTFYGDTGYVDEFRFSPGVVRHTVSFTPPTTEYQPPVNPPVAAFSCTPLVVWRNGTIQFTDDTTNSPTSWDWYDPDTANPLFTGNLSNQNPKVFPKNWGYHSVNLIACNGAGCSTKASGARYIYVLQPGVI